MEMDGIALVIDFLNNKVIVKYARYKDVWQVFQYRYKKVFRKQKFAVSKPFSEAEKIYYEWQIPNVSGIFLPLQLAFTTARNHALLCKPLFYQSEWTFKI